MDNICNIYKRQEWPTYKKIEKSTYNNERRKFFRERQKEEQQKTKSGSK